MFYIINLLSMQQQELCSALIEFEGLRQDLALESKYPFLHSLSSKIEEEHNYPYEEPSTIIDHFESSDVESTASQKKELSSSTDSPVKRGRQPLKVKKIKKDYRNEPLAQESDSPSSQGKVRPRKNKDMKNSQYPTKNFLPNFKGPHLQYLQRYLGAEVNNLQFIQYLRKKDGISLKDYEQLYQTKEFTEAFTSMFETKFLYRELLLSRSDPFTKKIHQKKVHVFQDAFKAKQFKRINY